MKIYYIFVIKQIFLYKQARQDLLPIIAFLTMRVQEAKKNNQKVMIYLEATKVDIASMHSDDTQTIKWYLDSSFSVHKDMRSHIDAITTLGNRTSISNSTKQKVNARNSTESKTIAADNTT